MTFDRKAYLLKHCVRLTKEEAQKHVDDGTGFVTSGAYTYCQSKYFSNGTFPGCLRGGDCSNIVGSDPDGEWYLLTLRDVVRLFGYVPVVYPLFDLVRYQQATQDFSIHLDHVVRYIVDSPYSWDDFQSGTDHECWQNYFKAREERYGAE